MQCFEDRADPPLQKENANFCEFFSPQSGAFEAQTATRSNAAKGQLDALFHPDCAGPQALEDSEQVSTDTDSPPSTAADARRKLDDLFN